MDFVRDAVGPYGILSTTFTRTRNHAPRIPSCEAFFSHPKFRNIIGSGGVSLFADEARLKAVAEGLERYSLLSYSTSKMQYGSFKYLSSLGLHCISPTEFTLYSEKQYNQPDFPYQKPSVDTPLWWAEVHCLDESKKVFYPAEFVYLFYPNKLHYPLSTGAAIHTTREKAKTNAIFEVIERDAIMLVWKRRIRVPQIRLNSIADVELGYYIRKFNSAGYDINIFDITMEHGIPTIFATARGCYGLPALSVSAGIAPTMKQAIKKAFNELVLATTLTSHTFCVKSKHPETVWDALEQHSWFYSDREHLSAIDFLFEGPTYDLEDFKIRDKTFNNSQSISTQIIDILRSCNFSVYYTEITPKDVAQTGLFAYKAIIPQMLPLDVTEPFDGITRLYNLPEELKKWKHDCDINKMLLPFA